MNEGVRGDVNGLVGSSCVCAVGLEMISIEQHTR